MPLPLAEIQQLVGTAFVKTDDISLALNSYDCSPSAHRPDAVVTVTHIGQLASLVKLLGSYKIPFVVRAAGTNHAGSCSAIRGGVILNVAPLKGIEQIDTQHGFAEVLPGTITGQLQEALRPLGYFYAPDPASEQVCTLGGNLAQNASGARCLKYGNTADNTLQIDFITPFARRITLYRDAPGPDWIGLIAGSEGTLGIIEKMRVKILPEPTRIKTFLATFSSLETCVQTVTDLVAQGLIPRCVEAMDRTTLRAIENFSHAGYPEAEALLILELDGSAIDIKKQTVLLEKICQDNQAQHFTAARTQAERQQIWRARRAAYAAMVQLAPNAAVGDGTVPRSELPRALQKVQQIIQTHGVTASLLFHAGDGNFHPQLVFDARSKEQLYRVHKTLQEILKTCVDCGGTISGEHGIGVEKRALMAYQYSRQTLRLFQQIKNAFDPQHLANPEKIIPLGFEEKAKVYQEQDAQVLALQQEIIRRFDKKIPSIVIGSNSYLKTTAPTVISAAALKRVLEIDKTNYTATVQAGIPLAVLQEKLSQYQVYAKLPLQYPGTLGGLVALKAAADFTSQIIGIQTILPNGDIVQYGGKIMKNAAGYNLCRLFTGSVGAFGLITQITFKIYACAQKKTEYKLPKPFSADPLFQAVKKEIDPHGLIICPLLTEKK